MPTQNEIGECVTALNKLVENLAGLGGETWCEEMRLVARQRQDPLEVLECTSLLLRGLLVARKDGFEIALREIPNL